MPRIVDHDARRQQCSDALWRVVSRDGAAAISIRSVAAEAGMSPSNLVHYLPTRADMLADAVERLVAIAAGGPTPGTPEALDFEQAVKATMVAIPHTPARRRQSEVWLLLVAERSSNPDARRILARLQHQVRSGINDGLMALDEAGLVGAGRDIDAETTRMHGLIDGLSLQSVTDPKGMPAWRIREAVETHLADLGQPAL